MDVENHEEYNKPLHHVNETSMAWDVDVSFIS